MSLTGFRKFVITLLNLTANTTFTTATALSQANRHFVSEGQFTFCVLRMSNKSNSLESDVLYFKKDPFHTKLITSEYIT